MSKQALQQICIALQAIAIQTSDQFLATQLLEITNVIWSEIHE